MTNEQAIKILVGNRNFYERIVRPYDREMVEALNMAIKALEDNPTGEHKCVTCKHCNGEIFNNYCRKCSRAWADLYEEAENE